jgi:hypothetical protein
MDTSTACIPVLAGWNLNMFDDLEPKQRAAEFVEHLQETFRCKNAQNICIQNIWV